MQITHVSPADQPRSVQEIAARLFPAYVVDGGGLHLAGCTLEDRLFVRFEFHDPSGPVRVTLDAAGREVDPPLIQSLGMDQLAELEKPSQPFRAQIDALVEPARALAEKRFAASGNESFDATAVWCKFAEGKVRFEVGESTAELPFADWACTLQPPPFVCPGTGCPTHHLAATDDGRIVAAESIVCCEQTGRRVLPGDLAACAATGRRVLKELLRKCPVTHEPVLESELVECRTCGEQVSPSALVRRECTACRTLKPVSKSDPRMARLLDEHPQLDGWRNWQISETSTATILTATRWLKRVLVVVESETLQLRRVAVGNRLLGALTAVEPSRHDDVLRG